MKATFPFFRLIFGGSGFVLTAASAQTAGWATTPSAIASGGDLAGASVGETWPSGTASAYFILRVKNPSGIWMRGNNTAGSPGAGPSARR